MHDAFIRELQRHGIRDLGIDIFNIRIESLSIQDQDLAKTIASQSLLFVETQAKLANMEAGNQIQESDAKQKASSRLILKHKQRLLQCKQMPKQRLLRSKQMPKQRLLE